MRFLSLFSGIEAASTAWGPMGWECAAVAELDPFASAVLAHRHPTVPNLGDVTKITEEDIAKLGRLDLVVFGSPCQDLSVAGKREGLAGARSGLFFTALRIIQHARERCGVRFALWENVPGAFSSNQGRDFAAVVDAMAGLAGTPIPPKGWGTEGCAVGEQAMVEWAVLDAQWFGVAQRRRRVFALADFGDWFNRGPILLEPHRLRRDTAPSREAGQSTAGTLASRTGAGGFPGTDEALSGYLQPVECFGGNRTSGPLDVSTALNASGTASGRQDFESETFVVHGTQDPCVSPDTAFTLGRNQGQENAICVTGSVTHTLTTEGFDAREDGTGRGTPLVALPHVDVMPTLRSGGGTAASHGAVSGDTKDEYVVPVAFDTTQITSAANRSNPKPGDPCHPLAAGAHAPALLTPSQVRRLTPVECERLQGFPDNYTAIPWRNKPADQCPDGPRYKALGNSMAVPVMRWIGQRIDLAILGLL